MIETAAGAVPAANGKREFPPAMRIPGTTGVVVDDSFFFPSKTVGFSWVNFSFAPRALLVRA